MKRLYFLAAITALLCGCTNPDDNTAYEPPKLPQKTSIYLAGDSTCAPRSQSDRPKWGWGEKFPQYIVSGYSVLNKAVGGKSTKTFYTGGQWSEIIRSLKEGDAVLIQFGHNDESTSAEDGRVTTPQEYYTNLCKFITDVKGKKSTPVILTPICRWSFADGVAKHTHKEYPEYAKKAAEDGGAVLLDIEQLTYDWLNTLGPDESYKRYMASVDGSDTTHLVELGATEVAEMIATALKTCGDENLSRLVK